MLENEKGRWSPIQPSRPTRGAAARNSRPSNGPRRGSPCTHNQFAKEGSSSTKNKRCSELLFLKTKASHKTPRTELSSQRGGPPACPRAAVLLRPALGADAGHQEPASTLPGGRPPSAAKPARMGSSCRPSSAPPTCSNGER
jgi:hypothetical protein